MINIYNLINNNIKSNAPLSNYRQGTNKAPGKHQPRKSPIPIQGNYHGSNYSYNVNRFGNNSNIMAYNKGNNNSFNRNMLAQSNSANNILKRNFETYYSQQYFIK